MLLNEKTETSVLDRILENPQNTSAETLSIPKTEEHYSLDKVLNSMLEKGKGKIEHKHAGNYYLTWIHQNRGTETPERLDLLRKSKHDLCVVSLLDKGVTRIFTHYQLEEFWNVLTKDKREKIHCVRKFWLGNHHQLDISHLTSAEQISRYLSERLASDVEGFVKGYKEYLENPLNPKQRIRKFVNKHGVEVQKPVGSWYQRVWLNQGLQYTTYTAGLVKSLATKGTIPNDIPPHVLSKADKALILEKLNLTKDTKLTKQSTKKETEKNVIIDTHNTHTV